MGYDLFVNDAFASSHRAHASIVGIPKILPSYAGLLMEKEVRELSRALTPPPGSIAIIGGAKFETKIPLLAKLLTTYSTILLGGALGNDIIKARGLPFGSSLISETPAPMNIAGNDKYFDAERRSGGRRGGAARSARERYPQRRKNS
jgi:3-phosphoglycerate kinase